MHNEGSDTTVNHEDGKTLDETVTHDKTLTSKLELEIQSLQQTVYYNNVSPFIIVTFWDILHLIYLLFLASGDADY